MILKQWSHEYLHLPEALESGLRNTTKCWKQTTPFKINIKHFLTLKIHKTYNTHNNYCSYVVLLISLTDRITSLLIVQAPSTCLEQT